MPRMKIATRRAWHRAWRLLGPLLPLALGAGLFLGAVAACVARGA